MLPSLARRLSTDAVLLVGPPAGHICHVLLQLPAFAQLVLDRLLAIFTICHDRPVIVTLATPVVTAAVTVTSTITVAASFIIAITVASIVAAAVTVASTIAGSTAAVA